jgi:hypothetical protein
MTATSPVFPAALAAFLASDTLTTAKIATLTGVTEVHHG